MVKIVATQPKQWDRRHSTDEGQDNGRVFGADARESTDWVDTACKKQGPSSSVQQTSMIHVSTLFRGQLM